MGRGRLRFNLILALVVAFGGFAAVAATGTSPRLGLDLEGGISVILTATGETIDEDVLEKTVEVIRQRIDALGVAEPEVSISGSRNVLIQLPGVEDEEQALELIGTTAQLTFRRVKGIVEPTVPEKKRPDITEETGEEVNDEEVVYPSGQQGEEEVLYVLDPAVLTGDVVEKAEAVPDPSAPTSWVVSIDMNSEGSDKWQEFTKELACARDKGETASAEVAIVLDGVVESAAGMSPEVTCAEGIAGGTTQITLGRGEETRAEAKDLALVLRTGSLPLTLEQSEVRKVSPTLGRDSLNAGITAGAVGLALVMVYMLVYYRALGLVVWLGLLVFTAVLYSLLSLLGETSGLSLSLAGVAGIIVAIGITTDSYIVAFERLKDEVRAGKSVKAAVQKGMLRAFKTILVADFVTASAAVILFYLAIGPVRGFALTLGLATAVDVLVAYFFTRSAVGLLTRSKILSEGRFIGMKKALGADV